MILDQSLSHLRAGEGFLSQSSKVVHIGLGNEELIREVTIHWPDGSKQSFSNLQVDKTHQITQGSNQSSIWKREEPAIFLQASPNSPPANSDLARIPLRYGIPLPDLDYELIDQTKTMQLDNNKSPMLVNLWASWCRPCLRELIEFRKHYDELESQDLRILALSVDSLADNDASNPDAAISLVERQDFPFETGFATNDSIGKLEAVFQYLFGYRRPWAVPMSLLLDHEGKLSVIYIGPVKPQELLSDLQQLEKQGPSWLRATLPFAGTWVDTPRHPNLLAYLSTILKHDYPQATLKLTERYFDTLAHDPECPSLLKNLAARMIDENNFLGANRCFELILKLNPKNALSHFQLAKLHSQEGNLSTAIGYCRTAIQLQPKFLPANLFLADLLQDNGELEASHKHLQSVVEQNPNSPEAAFRLGLLLQKKKQFSEAESLFEISLRSDPENPELLYTYGVNYSAQGKLDEAIKFFRKAHAIDPNSLAILNGLAWVLSTNPSATEKDVREAIRLAKKAAQETNYLHPQILDTLAASYAAAGEYSKAVDMATKAIELASEKSGNESLIEEIQLHLEKYRSSTPFKE